MKRTFFLAFAALLFGLGLKAGHANAQTAPDYRTAPLTQADVDLYLGIMREAANQIAYATGDDKAALDFMKSKRTGAMTPAQTKLFMRALQLSQLDDQIAEQKGVAEHYEAVREVIEGQVTADQGPAVGSCGGGGCGVPDKPTAQQTANKAKYDAERAADAKLIGPHKAEIAQLKKTMRTIMTGG